MPDIGLLQGSRPRITPPPLARTADQGIAAAPAVAPTHEVPAPFLAPVASAIAVVSAAPVTSTVVSATASGGTGAMSSTGGPPPIRLGDLLWLALALFVIVGTGLGIRDPWPADEPRFAGLARDMALSHEWLFPRVGGDLYQDKPPMFFWLLAICYTVFGSVKASFLIPSFLAAGGILFLVYDFGRRSVGREAGLAAALISVCTLQFLMVTRGAQIDATLCFLTTFSLYSLLRHLLLGPAWRWYFLGGFAAGVGIFTKGVGFLPVLLLIPYFALRAARWQGLAVIDAGKGGWRWWLAPLAMLLAVSMWFVPMLIAVATSGSAEYAAYRDEILFKQTVGRYAAAWHHVKPWYYFVVEVIPALWLPWSLLLFWLVPRFKAAFHERNARVWLPLFWLLIVLVFFSASPGKRGVYLLPALPALALAALPLLGQILADVRREGSVLAAGLWLVAVMSATAYAAKSKFATGYVRNAMLVVAAIALLYFLNQLLKRAGVRRTGFALAGSFWLAAMAFALSYLANAKFAVDAIAAANLGGITAIYAYLVLCGAGLVFAYLRAPLAAWPSAIGALAIVFSYFIAPGMNGERSGSDFVHAMLVQVKADEQLALVGYKEQFLLYLDRPTMNFGHRRWQEGPQESYDAAAWLNAKPDRVLLVPADTIKTYSCFIDNLKIAGRASDEDWYLVRSPAVQNCAEKGDAARAITYDIHIR